MRINGYGIIDREKLVSFTFDGRRYFGYKGDTLASALMANGVRVIGRSFKYHRPRGVLTAGFEEPNALVEIIGTANQTPNVRATGQEIFEGLKARSQNRWPSLRFDLLAVNDLAAPFLGAGFYYKTFMWPRAFWETTYEPIIRRAAGLGSLSGRHDEGQYEKAYAFCDVLVIGSGPAGIAAALTAAQSGADVILCEEKAHLGGRLLGEAAQIDGKLARDWLAEKQAEMAALPNLRIMRRTAVTGAYDGGVYSALERVGLHRAPRADLPRECFWRITAAQTILAAGALERPIAFENNDRPGIMLASAVQDYLNIYGVAAGKKVALLANNDGARRVARQLIAAGVQVLAILDTRGDASVVEDCPVFLNARITQTRGRHGLRQISGTHMNGEFSLDCDVLAVSGGWNPMVHLTCHMNGRPRWDASLAAFVPQASAVPNMVAVGACNGAFSTRAAFDQGIAAAVAALDALGRKASPITPPDCDDAPYVITPIWAMGTSGGIYARAWLDFANDVTVKDVALAAQEGFTSVEHMKRYTTQGMAPDQGKNSNIGALAVLADATGKGIPEVGTTTFRAPYAPTSIAAIGAGGRGMGFAPQRFMTSDKLSRERAAPMIEAGLWYRPSYFPKAGESDWQVSCNREVGYVRHAAGVADVSTLGKIDIQGRDAARFLDLVYSNTFSTLPVGRVRYGLMLRADGYVLDDGTTARLGQNHYLMTTTTAAAGLVMRHLEFVHQAYCADFDLRFISVTEAFAQFAVAGPRARALVNSILDRPLGDFPFMAVGAASIGGVAARVFRISFSGEEGYEIAVPTRFGEALFRDLISRAELMGGGLYGMEALNVLRIEKGFITHAEIDGRITAGDIGLGAMISAKKDCIGKRAAMREGMVDEARPQMIGLRPLAGEKITAGAHLFAGGAALTRPNSQGYVTSVGYSPQLQSYIALGFLQQGRTRHGEMIRVIDRLRGIDVQAEVCDPVFLDKSGERMRG
ncbi:MAG: sarcosine oxidase subunit alpha family protein [Cypionkella sp.]|nr:sarcosine oxidase subunit alpha family protein [Cypionkella sp.]